MKVCNNKLENESGYVPKSFSLSYLVPKTYYVSETINANYYGYLSIILCQLFTIQRTKMFVFSFVL